MGILPGICLLALLSVNFGQATEISPANLNYIVNQFHNAAGTPSSTDKALKQFAFLMVLNSTQCSKGINNFNPSVRNPKPEENRNYIATQPAKMANKGKQICCSETNLLFSYAPNERPAAQIFAGLQTVRNTLQVGGCVIFYTTNTPCSRRCFGQADYDIIAPLTAVPFSTWKSNNNIHMYFVYSEQYLPTKDLTTAASYDQFKQLTTSGFQRLSNNNFYLIYRCGNNQCRVCEQNNVFCLQWQTWPLTG